MAGNDFFSFFFFRTQFTAAWVFLLLRMENGEKIKDFIIHFHFLTVKVSQMGRISVKFSGCDYNKSSVFQSGIKSSVVIVILLFLAL